MNQLNMNNNFSGSNGIWPFAFHQTQASMCHQNNIFQTPTSFTNWTPQQMFYLQQQMQQKNLMELSSHYKQQQQQQQQQQQPQILVNQSVVSHKSAYSPSSSSASSSSTSSPVNHATTNFSSSFSVNSLLNSNTQIQLPASSSSSFSSPLSLTPDKMTNMNHANTAATVLGQQLASAMANYRLLQQQQQLNRLPLYPLNESIFQPTHVAKKHKFNEAIISNGYESTSNVQGLNLSQFSMASPSSSSSSSYSSSSDLSTNSSSSHQQNSIFNKFTSLNESNELIDCKHDGSYSPKLEPKSCVDNKQKMNRFTKDEEDRKSLLIHLDINPMCPICGLSLNLDDLQTHLELELESLEKLNSSMNDANCTNSSSSSSSLNISSNFNKASGSSSLSLFNQRKRTRSENDDESLVDQNQQINARRYLVYTKIKENRQERSKNKIRFTRMKENFNSTVTRNNIKSHDLDKKVICPLCDQDITDLKEKINFHLEECFSASKFGMNIATTSAFSKVDLTTFKRKACANENDSKNGKRVRTCSGSYDEGISNIEWNNSDSITNFNNENELLAEDLNGHEFLSKKESTTSKCLNCKEPRTSGVVSIKCSHVFCTKCWFNCLEGRKSCPNCNIFTDFTDLRRINL